MLLHVRFYIQQMTAYFSLITVVLAMSASAATAQNADLRRILNAPISIERDAAITVTPLEYRAGKLFLNASVNGNAQQFIFDTGSPTILSRSFADTMDLEIVGQNTGRDAHGTEVTMDIAILRSIKIGGVTFSNVPALIHDFSSLPLGPCFIDGGVIGSEIFPGNVWRIDLEEMTLTIANSITSLDDVSPSLTTPLHDFGYPHAPIIDYSVGDISDKALIDTGSAGQLSLFRGVLDDPSVQKVILPGTKLIGHGSEGESAGGRAKNGELMRFDISGLELSGQQIGRLSASSRSIPPTLFGAGLLSAHTMILDYVDKQFLLEKRDTPDPVMPHPGYTIAFAGEKAEVTQLYKSSPAAKAGLRLGDKVTEINGRSLLVSTSNPQCESARWLIESFDSSTSSQVTIQRKGQSTTLNIPASNIR